jgi:biopolymer transport protein ExbD
VSKRRRFDPDLLDQPMEIKNVLPLMDVMFALLTFFVMSTLFLTRTEGMSVNLPTATSSSQQKLSRATVSVDQQGNLYLDRSPIQLESLVAAVRQKTKQEKEIIVVLNADGGVTHDRVVQVMDQIRQIPGAKMAIATKRQ